MDKLNMQSNNLVAENIARIGDLFPHCLTEKRNEQGILEVCIDFEILKQELSYAVVDGNEERYQFSWPDKKKAILLSNAPTNNTLRPFRSESVDYDTTQNLYIEGDNLDVLKLLQETYLGRIKMIYIDPPYNTGHDFVYADSFSTSIDEYISNSGQFDAEGNRLFANMESNGRFHTDWLNMIYPRIRMAKNLLAEDGFIFISMDDNEIENLRKVCDEVFGEANRIATFVWQKRTSPDARKKVSTAHEYVLMYCRNLSIAEQYVHSLPLDEDDASKYSNPDNDPRGPWVSTDFGAQGYRPNQMYKIVTPGGAEYYPSEGRCWKNTEKGFQDLLKEGRMWFGSDGKGVPRKKLYLSEREGKNIWTWWDNKSAGHTQEATQQLTKLMGSKTIFDFPKPVRLIQRMLQIASDKDSIILDFFSGSATTAHAVMLQNAEDGGNRKFIMVQLPETTEENSDAYKEGYHNICEIGKERIRRAGKAIKETSPLTTANLDVGFRVLKLDSSNMKEVYYNPADYIPSMFETLADNIKEDRTPEDLLFQVMLDLGVLLSSQIDEMDIAGKKVFSVADGFLIACFDADVTDEVITEIAKKKPYYFVTRDHSMASDSVATNFDQIFATYSPETVRKVL